MAETWSAAAFSDTFAIAYGASAALGTDENNHGEVSEPDGSTGRYMW
jgi:hypothetical protein